MLSALSTVPPPTLFALPQGLHVSLGSFSGLATPWRNTGHYSTLMPLHILSFGWAFSPCLSLVLCGHSGTRPSLSFQLGVAASALFFIYCIYLWAAFFLGTRWFHVRSTPSFFQSTLSSHSACFDSLKYLAVALSLVQYFSLV